MRHRKIIIIVLCLAILGLDRWLKSLALSGLTEQWPFGQFVLFKNFGIIFSWPVPSVLAIILMFGALIVVSWLFVTSWLRQDIKKIIATSLMLIGAVSNIYDRLALGYIIDWAYLGQWWPVFNLADVFVATGLVIYLTSQRKPVSYV